ncbi:MAG: Ig-like domain-containing protein, partial [Terriglobales bacterium]
MTLQATADDSGALNITGIMPDVASSGGATPSSGGSSAVYTATATGATSGATVQTQFNYGHAPTDAERMIDQETYWNHRLTYPTGMYNPGWTRKAAEQDRQITRGVPRGRQRGNPHQTSADQGSSQTGTGQTSSQTSSLNQSSNLLLPMTLSPTSFTALGPAPEHMTGCSGCYDYGTTEGRINAIVIDPTTTTNGSIVAYAGSVGGGVWKTTNCCSSSTTWSVTTDDPLISTTSIDSLVIDPNDHNTIYAGTGDLNYGSFSMGSQGILKSTNAGASWTVLGASVFGPEYTEPTGQFPQYDSVGKVRVDPNNSSNVAAGTKKGLYFSYDGGSNWTGPCTTNSFTTQRQDITGLELSNVGGSTRIIAAVGVRGFATTVQYDLGNNGANGLYSAAMPAGGCPVFSSIASNANGFVFGAAAGAYAAGASMNAGSGNAYVSAASGNQLGRIDIAVAPSNPSVVYAQAQSITANTNSGCGNTSGCELGAWASTDGGASWTFMGGSAGPSLLGCSGSGAGSSGAGDYPQNWYDQGVVVDPNNADRVFFDTFEVWLASRTGSAWYDTTCGYNGSSVNNHVVHVDQHALAFVPGSSSMLVVGNDGGIHGTTNADTAALNTTRPTWFNMDGGVNTIEFYSGDISGNFATSASPAAVGGAQDNGPSSVMFTGSPTGPVQWQMGLGGDGFSGQIDPVGTGSTQAQGTISLTTGGAVAGETFVIGSQTFTFQTAARTGTGQVTLNSSTTTEGNNIVTAINADIPSTATATRSGSTVVVTAVTGGTAGNSIVFTETATNFAMNGGGLLGGTTQGDDTGGPRFWEGNNSGGLSRCISHCTSPGASWSSRRGGWTGDTQSFILPINLFHGGIPGGDDCDPAGLSTGCGHLIAGTTRVWETISGATSTNTWYVTSNPTTANLTKGSLGNRSFINQVKYSPKVQSIAIVGTNDGSVQIGFNLGTGVQAQATWVDVTGANAVLPNRPIMGIALDPSTTTAPIGYAAVGGFNENTPSTPGHIYRVVCDTGCASSTWTDKSGNLPNIPVDSIIANPNFPMQVFAGSDFGLYYTDDITANPPVWNRFNNGLPNVMIWDMAIDRGATTLSLWTRSRGAYVWPLPLGPENPLPTVLSTISASGTYGGTVNLSATLSSGGNPVSGKTIAFTLNGNAASSAITDASGFAALSNASLGSIGGGSYPGGVVASFAGDSIYAAATGSNDLTVGQKDQTITFGALANHVVGDAPFALNATASSGLPVSFAVLS